MMNGKKIFIVTLLFLLLIVISSCRPISNNGDSPVSSGDPGLIKTPLDFSSYQEQSYIDQIQILTMESFPLQVSVLVSGNLPDGCTSVVGSQAIMNAENVFEIHIYTERMIDALCTQALVPFEETVQLDVYGLDAGTYQVKANDLSDTFTFDMDNK